MECDCHCRWHRASPPSGGYGQTAAALPRTLHQIIAKTGADHKSLLRFFAFAVQKMPKSTKCLPKKPSVPCTAGPGGFPIFWGVYRPPTILTFLCGKFQFWLFSSEFLQLQSMVQCCDTAVKGQKGSEILKSLAKTEKMISEMLNLPGLPRPTVSPLEAYQI